MLYRFPDESAESYAFIEAMLPVIEHLPPPTGHSPVRLDRFSPYFERAEALGFSNRGRLEGYERVFRLPAEVLTRLAYFFRGTPRGALPLESMAPLLSKLDAWGECHRQDEAPALAKIELGGASIMIDTRTISTDRFVTIDATEARLLKAFRVPSNIAAVLDRIAEAEAPATFAGLVDRGWLVRDRPGEQAVSVVCEAGWRVVSGTQPFPGGGYRASQVINDDQPAIAAGAGPRRASRGMARRVMAARRG